MTKLTGFGLAFGMPIDVAVERLYASARELSAAAEKAPGRSETFGERIKNAVQRRMSASSHAQPRADGDESFGENVKKAVEKKSGRSQHKKQAEAERNRYPGYKRQRTKGE